MVLTPTEARRLATIKECLTVFFNGGILENE
jgi:hypothetical protein